MSQQRLNPFTAQPQVRQRLDQVETRNLQASGYQGVERRVRHEAMVAVEVASTEVQTDPSAPSKRVQSLDLEAAVENGRAACGLTHGQLCAFMADEHGKPLDQSLWTRMRKEGNLPFKRMRNLPVSFWWAFLATLCEAADMRTSHVDVNDLTVMRAQVAFRELANVIGLLGRAV